MSNHTLGQVSASEPKGIQEAPGAPDVRGALAGMKAARDRSEAELAALATEEPTEEGVRRHLRAFISDRFLLSDGFWDDSLAKLADHSIELAMGRSLDGDSLKDAAMHCTGATSSETKRALLLITLRKRLNLHIEPAMAVTHDSVDALAKEIARQLRSMQKVNSDDA